MKTFKQVREDAAMHKQAAKDHYYGAHLMKKYGDDEHHDSMSDHGSAGKAHRTAAAMSRKHGNDSPQYKQAAKAAKTASKDALSSDGHHDMKRSEPRYHDSMNDLKKSLKKPKKPVGEETVNELSKKTLGSYIKKAGQSHANITTKASNKQGTVKYGSDAEKRNDKRFDKADRRAKGLNRAIGKLVNKEGSLDELSRKTMGSYIKKAIGHDGYDERPNLGNIKQASSMKDKDRKDSLLGTQHFSDPKTGKSKLTHDMLKRMKANRKKGIATAVKKLQK